MIGKDLTRHSTPVFINEPMSVTQKLCAESAYIIAQGAIKATQESDPYKRLALISGHLAGAYCLGRPLGSKPFNPMLGETFEMVTP